ncbi:hypothetical protein OIO90_005702 [Microbotryomycetes sp. JL221]|nr:hypothetical protein OIO90_005702 [Microbotryomycetes sp. JL221]
MATEDATDTVTSTVETRATNSTSPVQPPSSTTTTLSKLSNDDNLTSTAQPKETTPANPDVAQLKSIFPDQTDDVLEAVLAANNGDMARSTEQLLAINDPSFQVESNHNEQSMRDEDYARALQFEEQEQQAARHERQRQQQQRQQQQQQQQDQPQWSSDALTYQPYVPKRRSTGPSHDMQQEHQQSQEQQSGPRDEIDQLSEQFSKLAEQGKRQFGMFLGKAKEQVGKFNEAIEKQKAQQAASGSSSAYSTTSTTVAASQPPQKEYTPPSRSSSSIVPEPLPKPTPSTPREAELPTSPAIISSSTTEPKRDFSKIGLLPRQQVSLLDQRNKKDGRQDQDDQDEDELEYVKSPFDDD